MQIKVSVIIAAAGCSKRMGGGLNKVLQPLGGKPVLAWSLALFEQSGAVAEIIVAGHESELPQLGALTAAYSKVKAVVAGGESRAASVSRALAQVSAAATHIAVHDAARPLLAVNDWQALLEAAADAPGGVILAEPPRDSVKTASGGYLRQALDRSGLLLAQTPQLFPADLLRAAYNTNPEQVAGATDEAELVAGLGAQIRYVLALQPNFKLTHAADLGLAELELRRRGALTSPDIFPAAFPALPTLAYQNKSPTNTGSELAAGLRVGLGWDIHCLAAGRPLILGGVRIPHSLGLLGHSDADVLLHALIDALLGAAAQGDIGSHFPDNEPQYAGVNSLQLLRQTRELLADEGWQIVNIDATVIAELPRLTPYREQIRQSIAGALDLPLDAVSLKAKTAEGLGEIGQNQAIAAHALAVIRG
jgi:2-C-methyl-D-erythritol 4-phosphate cytidylyltransferase / 2-C-methyl-D-erythritol 2,4-cyclodiphosphate synthase